MPLLMTPAQVECDRAAWRARRQRTPGGEWCISASELGPLLGIAPRAWGGPFALYWKKRRGQETVPTDEMRRGTALEPLVLDEFARAREHLIMLPGGLYSHPAHPWAVATLDGQAVEADTGAAWGLPGDALYLFDHRETLAALEKVPGESRIVVEAKTTVPNEDYCGAWVRKLPGYVRAQVIWQMWVTGARRAYVPVKQVAAWSPVETLEVEWDDAAELDLAFMIREVQAFRDRLAEDRPPPVDDTPATTDTLHAIYPGLEDRAVRVPLRLSRRYRAAQRAVARAKDRARLAQNELLDRAGTARIIVTRDPLEGRARDGYMVRVATRSASPRQAYTVEASDGPVHRLNPCGWAKNGARS